tara:strand:- start:562 stop:1311 length:750 start_codon:yes stop_codon:yes gene_type:complete
MSSSEVIIRVCLRDNKSAQIVLSLPANSTALDAMNASGLAARDGTPYRCFDSKDNVIDQVKLSNIRSDIFLGVPKEIHAVMIEESTCQGKVGKGYLMDGTTIFVPNLKPGEFAWVVISDRHGGKRGKANGFTIRMEGEPYQRGDIITIKPSPYSKSGARIFNPKTCKWDLPIKINMPPNVNREDYVGLRWVVRIDKVNPLVGTLDTKLTYRPTNQPEIARKARQAKRNRQSRHKMKHPTYRNPAYRRSR